MIRRLLTAAVWLSLLAAVAYAGESPQFRGPDRDGRFDEEGLMKAWPEGGPPVLWVAEGLGQGFSSASVTGGKIYVTGMNEDEDGYLSVLNLDGTVERKILYGKDTTEKNAPGPRSTPTLDGDRLYLLSGLGTVYCIDLTKGEIMWPVDILERFNAKNIMWKLAESVLIDGDRLICTPGGEDASVVALNKMTGETVWTSKGLSDKASYCSADIVEHNGRRLLLTETAKLVVGIDADTGAPLWTHDHPTNYLVHAVTPLYKDGLVYFTAGYGSGGGALELSPDGSASTVKWTDTNLDCQHHGVVLVDGCLYGTSQAKRGELMCLEMATGKLLWRTNEVRQGVTVFADGMLYVYEGAKSGIVNLVKAVPTGFERTGQFTVTQGANQHWAHPAIAGKRLYIRHGDALIAYDIAAK